MLLRNRGYILMMTLLLMTIAVLALAHTSRASLRRAMEAQAAQRQLQRHWGTLSCQRAVLQNADAILKKIEEETQEPAGVTRLTLILGDQAFDLVLADEQAKANVNKLIKLRSLETTEGNIRDLVRQSNKPVKVRLKMLPSMSKSEDQITLQLPPLGSFAQIFPDVQPELLVSTTQQPSPVSTHFTLWGDGKLNFHRATRQAFKLLCEGVMTDNQIDQLLSSREESPRLATEEALSQLALTKTKLDQLTELLTDKSSCHSLWVVVRDDERSWYSLAISESQSDSDEANKVYTFSW